MNEQPGKLAQLALKYKIDRWGHHWYCNHYERHFKPLENEQITLIEVGIGGYEYPNRGGGGLRMWADFFQQGKIFGVDIYPKTFLNNFPRIKTFVCSQDDGEGLGVILEETGTPDIIIDDASHVNPLTLRTFEILFPKLKSGGFYVIEDIETSWGDADWCKGCSDPMNFTHPSAINLARTLLNEVNVKYARKYESKYPIKAMHFYENLIIMQKA